MITSNSKCTVFCALFCQAGVTWKQDEDSNMFWIYIFPVSFAFPLVLPLRLFFLATGIRVSFPIRLSLITDPAVLKEVQQSLSPASFSLCYPVRIPLFPFFILPVLFFWCVCVLLVSFPLCSFLFPFFPPCFFFSAVSLLSPPFFSPLCSILPLAFIARGCRRFLATK